MLILIILTTHFKMAQTEENEYIEFPMQPKKQSETHF